MKQLDQTYIIHAPVAAVWKALTDGPTAEQWGAAPAKVDPRVGGEFSYWDGDIHGVFTKLVPEKLIEQDWYGHDNPTWKYNVVFTLEGDDNTTTVHMVYSGNILDEQKDIADWRDYYFDPIRKLLENNMDRLTTFHDRPVSYIETMQVKDGVECNTYSFVGDDTQDLAIVRVTKGFKTPLQKILQGNKTIEGFLEGKGTLVVQQEDGTTNTYHMDMTSTNKEVEVKVGQIMQWTAPNDTDLVFYEICDPPYKDGRFEDLA